MTTGTRKTPARFNPKSYDTIILFGEEFIVQPHPSAPNMRYSADGRKAVVFRVRDKNGRDWALKIFKKIYRHPSLVASVDYLKQVESFEGMFAATRRIVLPSDPATRQYSNLEYAMLMPWIHGETWCDMLIKAKRDSFFLSKPDAVHLCVRFLMVMRGLEEAGIAHTDISAGNVMLEINASVVDVQLLDLEDIYMPGMPPPLRQNTGSEGYRHSNAEEEKTFWRADADRYAAAVLSAEILVLANRALAWKATDVGFFTNNCRTAEGMNRFNEAKPWLKAAAPEFADLFERSWLAETIADCPSISELFTTISEESKRTSRFSESKLVPLARTTGVSFKGILPSEQTKSEPKPQVVMKQQLRLPAQKPKDQPYPLGRIMIVTGIIIFIILLIMNSKSC